MIMNCNEDNIQYVRPENLPVSRQERDTLISVGDLLIPTTICKNELLKETMPIIF